jgi:hypothetical protein
LRAVSFDCSSDQKLPGRGRLPADGMNGCRPKNAENGRRHVSLWQL